MYIHTYIHIHMIHTYVGKSKPAGAKLNDNVWPPPSPKFSMHKLNRLMYYYYIHILEYTHARLEEISIDKKEKKRKKKIFFSKRVVHMALGTNNIKTHPNICIVT